MIVVQIIDRGNKPIVDAVVMLDSIPCGGAIQDIAALTSDDGTALFDCESVKGVYTFKVFQENGELVTIKAENPTSDDGNTLILRL